MSVQPGTAGTVERVAVPEGGEVTASVRPLQMTVQTFLENRLAAVGLLVILAMVLFSFVGPLIYHTNQTTLVPLQANQPPSGRHPLGTDAVGFDILGRVMVGGQSSLEIGLTVAVAGTFIGVVYGAVSGVVGGVLDAAMMRFLDALFSIPTLFVLLILADIFKPSLPLLIVVLAVISWLGPARLVRGETLAFRTRDFVVASRLVGGGRLWVIRRHIVPNVIGVVVVNASFQVVDAILALASLTYLGLGLPSTASWGGMLSDGINNIYNGYWWEIYPAGLALVITVVAFSLVGDALRDTFETRLSTR
jgi:peptide/nickel transport system permease protein